MSRRLPLLDLSHDTHGTAQERAAFVKASGDVTPEHPKRSPDITADDFLRQRLQEIGLNK